MGENEKTTKKSKSWQYEKITCILGKWAWIFAILSALVNLLLAIWGISVTIQIYQSAAAAYYAAWGIPYPTALILSYSDIWNIIASIILIIFAFLIIRPRFSNKCAQKDWNYLLNDVLLIGNIRFPWMFIWAIIAEILGWWSGVLIIIPAILLIFAGPKEYKWKK